MRNKLAPIILDYGKARLRSGKVTPTLLRPSTIAMTAARLKTALASPVPTVAAAMLLVAARTPMPVVAANRAVALLMPEFL